MQEVLEIIYQNRFGIFGAILTACFIAYLTYRNGKKSRFAAASLAFRNAVHTAFIGLYPTPTHWPRNIDSHLRSVFPQLQSAVNEFRVHLPFWKRKGFDSAWREYHCCTGRDIDQQVYHHYVPSKGEGYSNGIYYSNDNTLTYKTDFKKNIDNMLSYAKEP